VTQLACVLDASVAIRFFVEGPDYDKARRGQGVSVGAVGNRAAQKGGGKEGVGERVT